MERRDEKFSMKQDCVDRRKKIIVAHKLQRKPEERERGRVVDTNGRLGVSKQVDKITRADLADSL